MTQQPRRPWTVTAACLLLIAQSVYGLGVLISILLYGRGAFASSFPDITTGQTEVMAGWALIFPLIMLLCAYGMYRRDKNARIGAIASQIGYFIIPAFIDLGMVRGCLLLAVIVIFLLIHDSTTEWFAPDSDEPDTDEPRDPDEQ